MTSIIFSIFELSMTFTNAYKDDSRLVYTNIWDKKIFKSYKK